MMKFQKFQKNNSLYTQNNNYLNAGGNSNAIKINPHFFNNMNEKYNNSKKILGSTKTVTE